MAKVHGVTSRVSSRSVCWIKKLLLREDELAALSGKLPNPSRAGIDVKLSIIPSTTIDIIHFRIILLTAIISLMLNGVVA